MRPESLLQEVGRRLRAARRDRDLTLKEAAGRAGVSTRYLRMAEAGEANLSLLKLAALARALRIRLADLCDLPLAAAPELRIALLGLRGCGKSSVGRALARQLEVPFVELDALVEERAGIPLGEVFSLHGDAFYRELQREALEAWLAQNGTGVIATGGSLVNDEDTFRRLRETCRTVWLRATPEEHWRRVVGQGDLRPIRDRPRAMTELRTLLESREPRYAQADLAVDTMDTDPTTLAHRISAWALD